VADQHADVCRQMSAKLKGIHRFGARAELRSMSINSVPSWSTPSKQSEGRTSRNED
jgi:hypothetical protein